MPKEVIETMPWPSWILESYGVPYYLVRELYTRKQK